MSTDTPIVPESTAQRHAALPRANGNVRPIAFPDRGRVDAESRFRANTDNARWQAVVERQEAAIKAAAKDAYDRGVRAGFVEGWHWGVVHGLIAGAVLVGALWAGWPRLQAAWAALLATSTGLTT